MPVALKPRLAFRRVRAELLDQRKSDRAFVVNQFELDLIEADYESWILGVKRQLRDKTYVPGPIEYCNAPKGSGLVRPGARLSIADRVVFTSAVGACLRKISAATRWSQPRIDFACQINPKGLSKPEWLLSPFLGWKSWSEESLRRLERKKTEFVLTADIAGFFENISIPILRSDLMRIGADQAAVALISTCLNHWAVTNDRGLPQGMLASDVLAKLYLEAFDSRLVAQGFDHVRYSDDIRVFCKSEREARTALVVVTELLRERGLTLQSAKTRIRPASGLKREFEGAVPAIKELNREYIDEAVAAGLLGGDPSLPVSVVDDLANAAPSSMDPALIRRAFQRFVLRARHPDKTMRRFLLRRLAALEDDYAVDHCAELVIAQPETSTEVLRYFEDLGDPRRFEPTLVKALKNRDLAMYPFQRYLVLGWLWRNADKLSKPTLTALRSLSEDANSPNYVRLQCLALLGRFGTHADQERIASTFARTSDPLERAQILRCMTHLERSRRNAILGRVAGEQPWVDRAVTLVRADR